MYNVHREIPKRNIKQSTQNTNKQFRRKFELIENLIKLLYNF